MHITCARARGHVPRPMRDLDRRPNGTAHLASRETPFTRCATVIHSVRSAIHSARSGIHFARSEPHLTRSERHFARSAIHPTRSTISFARSRSHPLADGLDSCSTRPSSAPPYAPVADDRAASPRDDTEPASLDPGAGDPRAARPSDRPIPTLCNSGGARDLSQTCTAFGATLTPRFAPDGSRVRVPRPLVQRKSRSESFPRIDLRTPYPECSGPPRPIGPSQRPVRGASGRGNALLRCHLAQGNVVAADRFCSDNSEPAPRRANPSAS
jgi:hypothetical protein